MCPILVQYRLLTSQTNLLYRGVKSRKEGLHLQEPIDNHENRNQAEQGTSNYHYIQSIVKEHLGEVSRVCEELVHRWISVGVAVLNDPAQSRTMEVSQVEQVKEVIYACRPQQRHYGADIQYLYRKCHVNKGQHAELHVKGTHHTEDPESYVEDQQNDSDPALITA